MQRGQSSVPNWTMGRMTRRVSPPGAEPVWPTHLDIQSVLRNLVASSAFETNARDSDRVVGRREVAGRRTFNPGSRSYHQHTLTDSVLASGSYDLGMPNIPTFQSNFGYCSNPPFTSCSPHLGRLPWMVLVKTKLTDVRSRIVIACGVLI